MLYYIREVRGATEELKPMANKIFAFVGPHSSGKATIITQLMSMGIPCIRTYTTYDFRENDPKTKIYTHMSREDFLRQDFIVKVSYKGHYYGILKKDVLWALENNGVTVMVLDVNGIKQINKLIKQNIYTIYLMADYVVLVDRMLRKGLRNDEIKYHLEYAEANNEFENWKTTNFVIKNTGKINVALEQILAVMGLMTLPPQEQFNQIVWGSSKPKQSEEQQ